MLKEATHNIKKQYMYIFNTMCKFSYYIVLWNIFKYLLC